MSKFEQFILIMVPIVLVLAFFISIFKKSKKKDKEEIKPEPEKPKEAPKPRPAESAVGQHEIDPSEFRSYLNGIRPKTSKPVIKEEPKTKTKSFEEMLFGEAGEKAIKSETGIVDEIKSLSPEVKAMLFAGLLDNKKFEE